MVSGSPPVRRVVEAGETVASPWETELASIMAV